MSLVSGIQYSTAFVGRRNAIINGNFDIWQRGTTQTSGDMSSDDRWINGHNGSTKVASQQSFTLGQAAVPNNPTYYSRTVVTSVAGASNYVLKAQRIEDVSTFAGETITLSFWAKADAAKNIATEYAQHFGAGGTPSAEVTGIGVATHALTTSWQKFTTTATIPSTSGKTLGTDGNHALTLHFWFESGSTYAARNNSLGQQNGTFDIAQVQVEKGDAATDFERRTVGEELALCERYYQKYDVLTYQPIGGIYRCSGAGTYMTGQMQYFKSPMRRIPTAFFSATPVVDWMLLGSATIVGTGALSITSITTERFHYYGAQAGTNNASYTSNSSVAFSATFDAEII